MKMGFVGGVILEEGEGVETSVEGADVKEGCWG